MQVVVDSLLTNYQQLGKGRSVLLLHGWGDSAKGLAPLQTELAKHYAVTAVDLPGFGGTQTPEVAWGLNDYADFVQSFAAKLRLKPEVIIGHSNGGAIAVRALHRGLSAKQLVLLASAGIRGEYKGRMKIMRLITKAGKLLVSPLPGRIKKRLRRQVYTSIGSDMLVAEHLQETFKKVVTDDVRADAAQLTLPTLLVYGDKDVSTPLSHGRKLHEAIKGSKLIVIPGAEHGLPVHNTLEVAKYIQDFINA